VARQEDLRRLWAVGSVALMATLGVTAIAVANSPWLDVDRVTVTGAVRADPGQVATATGVVVGQPLVEIDPDEVRTAVEAVPWVDTAVVRREWWGGLTVGVEERRPLVTVPSAAGLVLVDGTGRQLEEVPAPAEGLIPITGLQLEADPGGQVPPAVQRAVNLVVALDPALALAPVSVSVDEGQLDLHLDGGAVVKFGDDRLLADKLMALETMLASVDLTCLAVVRVQVPSSPTASRLPTAAPAPVDGQEPGDNGGGC
jgi:cell division protein FtsQ